MCVCVYVRELDRKGKKQYIIFNIYNILFLLCMWFSHETNIYPEKIQTQRSAQLDPNLIFLKFIILL